MRLRSWPMLLGKYITFKTFVIILGWKIDIPGKYNDDFDNWYLVVSTFNTAVSFVKEKELYIFP